MGPVVCYLHKIAITINFIISIGLLTLLSVDRYVVLVRNAWQNIRVKQRPPRIAHLYAMSVWLIGIMLSLPNIIVIKYESIQSASGTWEQTCGEDWSYYDNGIVEMENTSFVLPGSNSFDFDADYSGLGGDYSFNNDTGFDSYLDKMFDILDDELTPNETALMESNGWNFEKCNMIQQHEKSFIEEDLKMYNGTYNHSSCSTKEQYAKRIWLWVIFFTCFVGPATVMIYCYTKFVLSVSKVDPQISSMLFRSSTHWMILTRLSVFFMCWTPFQIFHLIRATGITVTQSVCTNLRDILSLMVYINSCVNPILYSFLGAKFRQRAKSVIITRPLRRLSVLTSPTVATSMAISSINGSPRQIADEQTLFTRLSSSFASSRRTSSQMSTRPSSIRYSNGSVRSQSHRPLGQSWSSPPSDWTRSDAVVAPPRSSPRLHSYGGRETTTIPEEPPVSELYQNDTLT